MGGSTSGRPSPSSDLAPAPPSCMRSVGLRSLGDVLIPSLRGLLSFWHTEVPTALGPALWSLFGAPIAAMGSPAEGLGRCQGCPPTVLSGGWPPGAFFPRGLFWHCTESNSWLSFALPALGEIRAACPWCCSLLRRLVFHLVMGPLTCLASWICSDGWGSWQGVHPWDFFKPTPAFALLVVASPAADPLSRALAAATLGLIAGNAHLPAGPPPLQELLPALLSAVVVAGHPLVAPLEVLWASPNIRASLSMGVAGARASLAQPLLRDPPGLSADAWHPARDRHGRQGLDCLG